MCQPVDSVFIECFFSQYRAGGAAAGITYSRSKDVIWELLGETFMNGFEDVISNPSGSYELYESSEDMMNECENC